MFTFFDTISVCDRQTDRRTDRHGNVAYTPLAWRRAVMTMQDGSDVFSVALRPCR